MPITPSAQRSTGRPPATDSTSRRTDAASRVGISARSQSTIRTPVAEVDHGNETATAVTRPSAICPSRGARTVCFTTDDSRLRSDMAMVLTVIFINAGAFAQHGQPALRTRAIALQHGMKPRIVGGQLPAVERGMPEMNDTGRKASILAAQAAMQQSDQQIGILAAPAGEASVEPIDPLEISAPNRKVAGARAAPMTGLELAQRPERQPQHRCHPIDAAAQALPDPAERAPSLRPEIVA